MYLIICGSGHAVGTGSNLPTSAARKSESKKSKKLLGIASGSNNLHLPLNPANLWEPMAAIWRCPSAQFSRIGNQPKESTRRELAHPISGTVHWKLKLTAAAELVPREHVECDPTEGRGSHARLSRSEHRFADIQTQMVTAPVETPWSGSSRLR